MKTHTIIRFNDLSYEKQEQLKRDCRERLAKSISKNEAMDLVGTDPDGHIVPEDLFLYIENKVNEGCDKSWVEWEIEL